MSPSMINRSETVPAAETKRAGSASEVTDRTPSPQSLMGSGLKVTDPLSVADLVPQSVLSLESRCTALGPGDPRKGSNASVEQSR